ncbi:MAG: hypothetical protein C4532_18750 [Candidatus Abyssobacteria bacterium SURF_17]|uniref:YMGG-like Gly-zipper domain-containing protein n=1 Tax=Candidatus Abyssobacteria bacterium SURF_17 TaxID=2093361 RepID=A0A419ENY4_9BACT|nr:MAG: hypothetical protein C4532_18750 [Candidatus Abyssubacteria bacterium SURF_17]
MKKVLSIFLCFAVILAVPACSSIPEEHKGAAVGAGVGAGAGAIAGGLIGDDIEGAVIGGLVGALVGGVIGHYAYDQRRTGEQTADYYDYDPARGAVLTIEDASAVPQTLRPGETVDLKMTYAVLNPVANTRTEITEMREITYNGQLVGRPEVRVTRTDGTYTSSVPLRLPSNAGRGLYIVRTTVRSQYGQDTLETGFTVL